MSKQVITDEQILNLPPGRDLDSHIALRVMGFKQITIVGKYYFTDPIDTQLKSYSTDIAAAWEVLQHLKNKGAEINVGFFEQWDCSIDYPIGCNWRSEAETAPEAICKAALLAVIGGSGNE